jgi:hypothetical protein
MSKSALVLARGSSLEKIKDLHDKDYDLCVIINDWNREVNFDYVEEFLLKQKKVYHYICREGFALLTKDIYNKFDIEKVYLNCLEKEYKGIPPYRANPFKAYLDRIDVNSDYLEDKILDYSEPRDPSELRLPGFPTMGVLTTTHVASCLGYENVTVVGLDFYEAEYLTVCSSTKTKEAPKKSGIDKAPRMKGWMKNVIEKLPDTNFEFYTYSTFDPGLPNVTIHNKR